MCLRYIKLNGRMIVIRNCKNAEEAITTYVGVLYQYLPGHSEDHYNVLLGPSLVRLSVRIPQTKLIPGITGCDAI
jgi:hypothetical protein